MRIRAVVAASILLGASSISANAGIYTDDLSRCLVLGTNKDDRIILTRWMTYSFAQHPSSWGFVSSDVSKKERIDTDMGALVTTLLTVKCAKEVKDALRYDGEKSVEFAFQALGQIATVEIIENSQVKEVMMGFAKKLDLNKFKLLME